MNVRWPGCRHEDLAADATELAREFSGRFDISICRARDGRALIATRRAGTGAEGVYAVITPDPEEMREALSEDEDSPPGSEAKPGGG